VSYNFDSPLFSSPRLVPALAAVFDNAKEALLRATKRGLDPISLATNQKLSEKQFKTIQTLVGGADVRSSACLLVVQTVDQTDTTDVGQPRDGRSLWSAQSP
jgi:hypothetical protein